MLESVEIFEKFDFLVLTYDPITLKVQFKGSHAYEPAVSLIRALFGYDKQSKREILNAVRNRQREGNVILLSDEQSSGAVLRTVFMWRFDEARGKIIGIVQPIGSHCSFVNTCAEVSDARGQEENDLWDLEGQRKPNGEFSLVQGLASTASLPNPKERLVQLNVALEGAKLGFWDWNRTSNVLLVNIQWAKMIGYKVQEIKSADFFFERLHPDDKEKVEIDLARYSQGKTTMYRSKFRLKHKEGHYVPIEAVGAFQVRKNRAGSKQIHMSGIHRDRSEEVAREDALQAMVDKATDEIQAKSRFLANVSHEIRTPIHGILNMIQFAKSYHTAEKQLEYLNAACDSARALGYKLDGLVDYANLENVPIIPELNKAKLLPLFNLARSYCWGPLQDKSLAFEMEIDPQLHGVYDLDEKLIAQILLGFLDNAVKFTHDGLVQFFAKLIRRSSRPDKPGQFVDEVEITFCDTGIGMSDEQLIKVFLPYQQKNTKRSRAQTGIGVGLNLVHACIEALGGEVEINSEPGFGTEVKLKLCLRGYEGDVAGQVQNALSQTQIRKVLVVDDVGLNRMIVRAELEQMGIEVEEAENGQMVVKLFENPKFETDLVLMDVQMPIMDGITATKKLREEIKTKVPIIGITADATRETEKDGLEAGMNEVYFKPVDIATVLGSIQVSGVGNPSC